MATDTGRFGRRDLILRLLLLCCFVLLVCARMPDIVLHGRFWAEEGHFFFRDAVLMGWRQALLQPIGGYLNLVANGAGLLAHHLVPLRLAPFVTTGVALLVQCCPLLVLLSARDRWLQPPLVLAAATLLLATPAAVDETWLNSIHSQFQLGLADALILALEPVSGPVGLFRLGLLLLGPLAGPASLFLAPLFALRVLTERSPARLVQAVTLGAGGAVQLLLFFEPTGGRSYGIGPAMLACVVFVKQVCVPMLGHDAAARIGRRLHEEFVRGSLPFRTVRFICLLSAVFLFAILRTRVAAARWLFGAAILTAILSDYGAIDGRANLLWVDFGQRYALIPSVLLALSLLALAADRSRRVMRPVAALLVAWIVAVGLRDEATADRPSFAHGPNWSMEVRRWQADPAHPLAIWPDGWTIELPAPR